MVDLVKTEGGLLRANTWNIPAAGIATRGWGGLGCGRKRAKLLMVIYPRPGFCWENVSSQELRRGVGGYGAGVDDGSGPQMDQTSVLGQTQRRCHRGLVTAEYLALMPLDRPARLDGCAARAKGAVGVFCWQLSQIAYQLVEATGFLALHGRQGAQVYMLFGQETCPSPDWM
jgi:hypothetical protein